MAGYRAQAARTLDEAYDAFLQMTMLPVPWIEAFDSSETVLSWPATSRCTSPLSLPVDAGCVEKLAAG